MANDISSKHPAYSSNLREWTKLRDCYGGEGVVKDAGQTYLPPTPGHVADGMDNPNADGYKNYMGYLSRARFPDFVSQSIEALVGILHHKPATIELPAAMESLLDNATVKGESLEGLLRRINEEQLITGRLGILADVPDGAPVGVMPYIAMYKAEDIINWDDGKREDPVKQNLNFVVLDESEQERIDIFNWEQKEKYRVLMLGDPQDNESADEGVVYSMGVFRKEAEGTTFNQEAMMEPSIAGENLDQIPFVFINSKDLVSDPDDPPLLGLADLSIAVYRAEADYRQALFMQGQDTLVVVGSLLDEDGDDGKETRVGAGAKLNVMQGGDAKYIGVSSTGLPEMRSALENDRREAAEIGGKLLDTRGGDAESGEALRIRVSARTASLTQIAKAGAEGLQMMLRIMAEWVGANPEEVIVEPNLDFADDTIDGRTMVDWMTAKRLGLPLSLESIHRKLQEKDLTELEFEEEVGKIEEETDLAGGLGTDAGGDPNDDQGNSDGDE